MRRIPQNTDAFNPIECNGSVLIILHAPQRQYCVFTAACLFLFNGWNVADFIFLKFDDISCDVCEVRLVGRLWMLTEQKYVERKANHTIIHWMQLGYNPRYVPNINKIAKPTTTGAKSSILMSSFRLTFSLIYFFIFHDICFFHFRQIYRVHSIPYLSARCKKKM